MERVAVGGEGACMECVGCMRHGVHVGSLAGFKKGLGLHCGQSCTCQTELKVVRRLGDFVMLSQRMRGRIWSA